MGAVGGLDWLIRDRTACLRRDCCVTVPSRSIWAAMRCVVMVSRLQRTRNAYPDFAIPQCCSRTMAPRLSHGTTWRRRCAWPCAGMRWGSGTSASVPAARVPQFTRAIASQCGAAWSRTGTSSTATGRSSVRWHIRTSGGEGWRCNMVGMVGSSWAEVQQRGICAYIVPPI